MWTHRKTEEPWAERPKGQEQRKNKIAKARLKYQQRPSGSKELNIVCKGLAKDDSNTLKLPCGTEAAGFSLV